MSKAEEGCVNREAKRSKRERERVKAAICGVETHLWGHLRTVDWNVCGFRLSSYIMQFVPRPTGIMLTIDIVFC